MMAFLILVVSLVYYKNSFNPFYIIKMYDVGQGESILISLPHGKGNILIDCYNNVCDYLKKDGVKNLDLVFISHGHDDHMGAYEELVNNFQVKSTYSSFYDDTELLNELKRKYAISLLKADDKIKFDDLIFHVLGPIRKYTNENDNSLVMKVEIEDISILFTGDIEKEAENDLINKYSNYLNSDILKVSHHGSDTSSSELFLSYVSPTYLLISVGRNNYYGFPNNHNLLTYKNIYRTDLDYSICLYKRKKWFYIEK